MEKLLKILHDLHPDVDFLQTENLIEGGILDSFDIVTIVAETDMDYGVAIPPEELTPANFNSAQALYDLICRLQSS